MLSRFGALPTEARARDMKARDYLWCLAQELLDREEALEGLCPACRARALGGAVPGVRRETGRDEGMVNPAFDPARFEALKGGGAD